MKNGQYNEITEIGLPKNISWLYFKGINYLEREFKKGRNLDAPVATIIKGDSKLVVPLDEVSKEEYVASLKVACHFLDAEAIMIFAETSKWTGTEGERQFVMEQMGEIHGHVKSKDNFTVIIETREKYIVGTADMHTNGKRREIGKFEWGVMDIPNPDDVRFSNFLPKKNIFTEVKQAA
ncbi:hypothetical protein LGM85_25270 [Burkholderia multivorans]|uniref:hypothetical protein n=1 Tax=Burkholderia multivorans TaxID=87883 RepID=UPI002019C4E6|nr:hypothetical protein [Burkholderia multivorans]MCA8487255.1 hypothetical protein [Burkholderia multivorans]MCL4663309.1 hypothetical protein [Burkholderia multivorans]MCO1356813.1 hypothetical protein [Burkholderia multivorans]MCO1414979.1 hypothetical protein [Burkholderia multivorans]MCO1448922.1 hypothetical protein [Burkholderia multivorans]